MSVLDEEDLKARSSYRSMIFMRAANLASRAGARAPLVVVVLLHDNEESATA